MDKDPSPQDAPAGEAAPADDEDYDAMMEEIKRKRELRKKQAEEDEKREEEERLRREAERKNRRATREDRSKQREAELAKESEERKKKESREEERRRKREERERERLQEELKEKEEELKRQRERDEKRKRLEEEEERERLRRIEEVKRNLESGESSSKSAEQEEEQKAKKMVKVLEDTIAKHESLKAGLEEFLLQDEDRREELTTFLSSESKPLTEFLNTQEMLKVLIAYVSTVHPVGEPEQMERLYILIEFAREMIAGGMPALYKSLCQPENRGSMDQLWGLFAASTPPLPPINVHSFKKIAEALLMRRSYEVSAYILSRKDALLRSLFKHIRDPHIIELLRKLVENECSDVEFRDYKDKEDPNFSSWCDIIPTIILEWFNQPDDDFRDMEIEHITTFVNGVIDKHPKSRLTCMLQKVTFLHPLVQRAFSITPRYEHSSTMGALLAFLTCYIDRAANKSDVDIPVETAPPIIQLFVAYKNALGLNVDLEDQKPDCDPVIVLQRWLRYNYSPELNTNTKTFGTFRVRCLQCIGALVHSNYKSVDNLLNDSGVLQDCLDIFFYYQENNIIHAIVEDVVKSLIGRETRASTFASENLWHLSEYLFVQCKMISRMVEVLSGKYVVQNLKFVTIDNTHLRPSDETPGSPVMTPPSSPRMMGSSSPAGGVRDPLQEPKLPKRWENTKRSYSPQFSGHVLNVCKLINQAAEKSPHLRQLLATCSDYRWGQVVVFKLRMKDGADHDWKTPMRKVADANEGVEPPRLRAD